MIELGAAFIAFPGEAAKTRSRRLPKVMSKLALNHLDAPTAFFYNLNSYYDHSEGTARPHDQMELS